MVAAKSDGDFDMQLHRLILLCIRNVRIVSFSPPSHTVQHRCWLCDLEKNEISIFASNACMQSQTARGYQVATSAHSSQSPAGSCHCSQIEEPLLHQSPK